MPKDVKFNIKLNIDGKEQIVTASTNTKSLADSLGIAKTQADKLRSSLITFTQANSAIQGLSNSLQNVMGTMTRLIDVNTANVEAETKLANNMRNTMSATEDDVKAIKDLCAAQQELGVISQGTQEAGAQELATYLEQKSSLETLIPVMNDMLAQQYGLNATSEQAATIGSMLGKVMEGQTGALSRYGYSFTEAQEEILKFGTEEERAATLADVVTAAVGGMNKELAKTDAGQAKQAAMRLDDLRASAGSLLSKLEPMIKQFTGVAQAMLGVGQAATGIMGTVKAVNALTVAIKAANVATKSLMGLGVGAALAALTVIITKLTSSTKEASEATEALKSAQEAGVSAQANAKVEIDSQIKKLKDLKDRNADTSDAVKNLNDTYGNIFGTYKTANEWIETLSKNQSTYVKLIGYEAQQRQLATKAAEKEIALQERQAELQKVKDTQPEYIEREESMDLSTGMIYSVPTQRNPNLTKAEEAVAAAQKEFNAIQTDLNTVNELAEKAAASIETVAKGATGETTTTTTTTETPDVGYIDPGVYNNLQDYADKLADLQKQRMQATKEQLANIDEEIKAIEAERDAFLGLIEANEEYIPESIERLNTLNKLSEAIKFYKDKQGEQSLQEAQDTQKTIDLLELKEKTMRDMLNIPSVEEQTASFDGLTGRALEMELRLIGADQVRETLLNLRSLLENAPEDQRVELENLTQKWEGYYSVLSGGKNNFAVTQQGLQGIGSIMGSLSGVMDEETAQWMQWGQQVLQSVASAIPSIMSLVAAKNQEATANTAAAASGAASSVASIPIIGWVMAVSAVAAIVAALSNLPKFAAGGIAYGPTLGMFGEYAGASNNPEVVAPLDRLRSLIKTPDDNYGKVKFEIEGRTLRGVLTKEYNLISRS